MIRALLFFVALLAAWAATLWFGIKPDFSQWPQARVLALHAGPPLALAVIWGLWRIVQWSSARNAGKASAEAEAAETAKRQAARDEARRRHAEDLRHRQRACDCRGVAMMQVGQPESAKNAFGLLNRAVEFSPFDGEAEEDATLLAHLSAGIVGALESLYSSVPGAAVFPVYVVPPAEVAGTEVFACVQEARAQALNAHGLERRQGTDFNRVLFLPGPDIAADRVLGLFDNAPDLPGAVILAFDSAWLRRTQNGTAGSDSGENARHDRIGEPSQGVFALLVTSPDLESRLDAATGEVTEVDAMTPYWERGLPAAGQDILLAALTPEEKDSLGNAAILARIHRAGRGQFPESQQQALSMTRTMAGLIEHAQVNAALIDSPFDALETTDNAEDFPAPDCGWLVHNAGSVDRAGRRLAALGTALQNRGLSTDPVDAATNVVVQGGDYGQARSVALLALTVARVVEHNAAALCVEFSGDDGVGVYFALPPRMPA